MAQKNAYDKNYTEAEILCRQAIALSPNNEYKIFLGRIYAWHGKSDSARTVLSSVIINDALNIEAYDALTDVELWQKEYTNVINYCNTVLTFAPADQQENFLMKRAKAYYFQEDDSNAKKALSELVEKYPNNKIAQLLLKELEEKRKKNALLVSYLNVSFNNPRSSAWHFTYIEYQRKLKNCPLLARFNYGNAYTISGYQLEIDAYPKFGKKTYMYTNAGYSTSNDVFPRYRAGAEIYQALPKGFEISGGARYMRFLKEDVFIYTAYLGKYYKAFWFAYRPFVVNRSSDIFASHTAIIRRYFSHAENYLSLNLIYGATPYTTTSYADIIKVNSQRIGIDFQYQLPKSFLIKPMFSFEYDEYFPGSFRNRFYSQLIVTKRF